MKNNASYWWLLGISLIYRIPSPGEIFILEELPDSTFQAVQIMLEVVHKGPQILTFRPRESLSVELRNLFLRYSLVI